MAERNNADALNELTNGVDGVQGLKTILDTKFDKNKVYTSTGSNTDGTMTQKAITDSLNGKLNSNANAVSATKLANSRNIQTNLGSTTAASFDGTANITPGVTGTLPVANGGTGTNNLANITVGAATKATQDGDGNVIKDTYAKLESQARFNMLILDDGNGGHNWVTMSKDYTAIMGQSETGYPPVLRWNYTASGVSLMIYNPIPFSIRVGVGSSASLAEYEFKSDGIYLNGTKITN